MRSFWCWISSLVTFLAFSSVTFAQIPPQWSPRDLNGMWSRANPGRGGGTCEGCGDRGFSNDVPPMTPWGQAKYDEAKPGMGPRAVPLGNDPMMICDPLGYPRWLNYNYGMEFVHLPGKTLQFFELYHTYRTIWTDGRPLPKEPEPRWLGYSIGKWEGDTLVVDVTGLNDQTWFDRAGNFHSEALHVTERYTYRTPDVIDYEATIEDPKVFTRPWKISLPLYRRMEKNAHLLEFKCVEYTEELIYGHLRKQ